MFKSLKIYSVNLGVVNAQYVNSFVLVRFHTLV